MGNFYEVADLDAASAMNVGLCLYLTPLRTGRRSTPNASVQHLSCIIYDQPDNILWDAISQGVYCMSSPSRLLHVQHCLHT